ncbi:DUF4829 domain-containing protein [Tindallia californiensis]|uniref:DUF4829 domain-containing protein n=1 Tax=Tindallia californiensis TaxID=159292 RepID=A0A1H3QNF6_9FIRM|nr:DUF4829 domain-containing protein [Tindallia californiensis]SDZ14631.1 protein of unknown function [Tindallia californiensis]
MKRVIWCSYIILLSLILMSCSQADKDVVLVGESEQFSDKEINQAIECVKEKFKDFNGCELTDIWYDEERSNSFIETYMNYGRGSINGVSPDNVMVLLSNFTVDESSSDGSLEPNSTYTDWMWILNRESNTSDWTVDDWGY